MRPLAVDVLILGAGLAGLRAALSCLMAAPSSTVLVASLSNTPAGSSFANQNNALGIHACANDAERQAYCDETKRLNRGALLIDALLTIQADEGWERLMDLADLGLAFNRNASGQLLAHSSCFSPDSRRAYVFTGLTQAYHAFRSTLDVRGCRFLAGHLAAALLPGGALLMPETARSGPPIAVGAKVTIVALGGPGRLFAHSMAGPGVPGYSHGLLDQAGVRLANTGILQWMWGTMPGKTFWQPAALSQGDYTVRTGEEDIPFAALLEGLDGPGGSNGLLVEGMAPLSELAASRSGHCPFGYGLPDTAIDLALARRMDACGVVHLLAPDGQALAVAPMAHASNGGAVIDEWGQTNVPGLLACGECATGMHGANRLGGGMILASQVFGHRAGLRAAQLADTGHEPDEVYDIAGEMLEGLHTDMEERRLGLGELGLGLSRFAALGGRPGHTTFKEYLEKQSPKDWLLTISRDTALEILASLPYPG